MSKGIEKSRQGRQQQISWEILKVPIDKSLQVCYNKYRKWNKGSESTCGGECVALVATHKVISTPTPKKLSKKTTWQLNTDVL